MALGGRPLRSGAARRLFRSVFFDLFFLLNHALYTPFEIDKAGEMEAELVLVGLGLDPLLG